MRSDDEIDREYEDYERRNGRSPGARSASTADDDDLIMVFVWIAVVGAVIFGVLAWLDSMFGWGLAPAFGAWISGMFSGGTS